MNWDYNKMCLSTGDYWNKRPLDEQMAILQKYYPIGMKLKYYVPEEGRPPLDYAKVVTYDTHGEKLGVEIVGYVLQNGYDASWYILQVRNDERAMSVKGKEYEDMHIGFFQLDPQWVRTNKLEELGI